MMLKHLNDKKIDQFEQGLDHLFNWQSLFDDPELRAIKDRDTEITAQENELYKTDAEHRQRVDECKHKWRHSLLFATVCQKCGRRSQYMPPGVTC